MDFVAELRDGWAVIGRAPFTVAILLLAAGAIGYGIAQALSRSQIDSLNAIIKLRDAEIADWKRKTEGATPDAVKGVLDALHARLDALTPRRLTPEQRDKIASYRHPGGEPREIEIAIDGECADAVRFGADLVKAFESAGWKVESSSNHGGLPDIGPTGMLLQVSNRSNAPDSTAIAALEAAKLPFAIDDKNEQRRRQLMLWISFVGD